MTHTYSSYLRLDELLELQAPLSEGPEHDEHLFIVIHQVYELWFRQVLHELDHLHELLLEHDLDRGAHTLTRVLKIFKVLVSQVDVLETMTPLEFLSFRERLGSASGFQSWQFRELEACLGLRSEKALAGLSEGSPARRCVEARLGRPGIWEAFLSCVVAEGFAVPSAAELAAGGDANERLEEALVDMYRNAPGLAALAELLVDLDEGLQEWRYRHVKMVERTIGRKTGTGGSSGVAYLASTLAKSAFPALWAVRSRF